eukprot:CAMPEP_0201485312 /NCGR_PEP_ID=MMETSP0151_2-20130828/9426_1 /ASSEMBLY_ACC=CAM_ASM_000257 /TAXON_ID=200890 /ORGANISM="Paramoeba atlantica, Strain 621/1 / CCAP 1560/9" /LENGTH=329 /DNA_ID=CAMNT_0047869391 /DNA_START=168 /DNA_END=1157 /DNA_ORIENTATION=+
MWEEDSEEEGCRQTITHAEIESHKQRCVYRVIRCPYGAFDCPLIRKKALPLHLASCPHRPVKCPHCQRNGFLPTDAQQHVLECDQAPTKCEQCGEEVTRGGLKEHLEKLCEQTTFRCPFHLSGCTTLVKLSERDSHLASNTSSHLLLLQEQMVGKVKELEDQLRIITEERDQQIQALQKQISSLTTPATVRWKIEKFSVERKKPYLPSKTFSFCGMSWFLGMYTDGDSDASRGFFSLYLFLEPTSTQIKAIGVEFSLSFERAKENGSSIRKSFRTVFPIKGQPLEGKGWGDRRIIRSDEVTVNSGYVSPTDILNVILEIRQTGPSEYNV